jgi:glycosyltransferase involved in cell wall biosynthesis
MIDPDGSELRVVHIVTAFQRHEDDVITPWLTALIRAQRARGADASVLAPSYRGLGTQRVGEIDVRRFRYAPRGLERLTHEETVPDRLGRSPLYAGLLPLYMAGGILGSLRLGRQRPDVVHVHWPVPHAVFGAAARIASGGRTAMVCTYYSVEIRWIERRMSWLRPLLSWSVRSADGVTAISTETASRLPKRAERDVSIVPFASALEAPNWEGRRTTLDLTAAEPLQLLFVGRLVERKGVEHLVEALSLVRRRRAAKLTLVGEGEWRSVIERAAERLELEEHVTFAGHVSEEKLREHYESCDIFVLPAVVDSKGDTEGLGVVLLEALGFERPVVASAVGGITDIVIPERTGWLTRPGDAPDLARTIEAIADDPERARHVARQGRRFVEERFSMERIAADLENVYRSAIARRTGLPEGA